MNCIITLDSGDLTSNISGSRISSNGKVRGFIHHSVIKCQIKDRRFRKKIVFYLLSFISNQTPFTERIFRFVFSCEHNIYDGLIYVQSFETLLISMGFV